MESATQKERDYKPSKKELNIVEGYGTLRGEVLLITEVPEDPSKKGSPLVEEVLTKPVEHANVYNISKENNMSY